MTLYNDVIKALKCKIGYDVTKSAIWVGLQFLFFLKSTPQDGHFEVLIIQYGSETKKKKDMHKDVF